MKKQGVIQQSLLLSILIHCLLVLALLIVFYKKESVLEDIPVEITEFIRNLSNPDKAPSPMVKKKTSPSLTTPNVSNTASNVAQQPSANSSNNKSLNSGAESVSEDYEVSEMPILLNEVRVPYPPEAKLKNIQGSVVFDLLISSQGTVQDLKVVSSPDPVLTAAAQNAVSLFKFRPARMSDKSVAIRIRYTYRFLLK